MKHAEDEQNNLADVLFREASEGMMVTDGCNRIIRVNPAFSAITGYSEAEVIGRTPHLLSSGRHDRDFYAQMWGELHERGRWQGEIWNRRKNGSIYPEWLSIVLVRSPTPWHIGIFSDITGRRAQLDRLEARANLDPLTGLPNRALFLDRLQQALASAQRNRALLAVAFVDLDRFKWVNDMWGHQAGDHLLQVVAERLQRTVRAADTVARIGGDEFAVILNGVAGVQHAEAVMDRALLALGQAVTTGGELFYPSASVGLALFPQHAQEAQALLARADEAMYVAKRAGGRRHSVSNAPAVEQQPPADDS